MLDVFPLQSPGEGGNPLTSDARLRVRLEDLNDHDPSFIGFDDAGVYPAAVPEHSAPGQVVASVFAIDLDGTSPNNKVNLMVSMTMLFQ